MSEASSSPEQPIQEPPKRREPPTFAPREEGTHPMPPQVGPWSDQEKPHPFPSQHATERPGDKKLQETPPGAVLGVPRPVGHQVLPDAHRPDWSRVDQSKIYHPDLIERILERFPFLRRIARKLHLR